MILKSIRIRNFMAFNGDNKIDFSTSRKKNVTLITGGVASGKSSILAAIKWCLFGYNKKEKKNEILVLNIPAMESAKDGDIIPVGVELEFLHSRDAYRLTKTIEFIRHAREVNGWSVCKKPKRSLKKYDASGKLERVRISSGLLETMVSSDAEVFILLGEDRSREFRKTGHNKALEKLLIAFHLSCIGGDRELKLLATRKRLVQSVVDLLTYFSDRMSSLKISVGEKYKVELYKGKNRNMQKMLSSSEQHIFRVAFVIAMMKALNMEVPLVMDNIFAKVDYSKMPRVFAKMPANLPQLILIESNNVLPAKSPQWKALSKRIGREYRLERDKGSKNPKIVAM